MLDPTLYIPALTLAGFPDLLAALLAGSLAPWLRLMAPELQAQLQSFESRLHGPILKARPPSLPPLHIDSSLLDFFQQPLAPLVELATSYATTASAYGSVNCSYLEVTPALWQNEQVEAVVCQTCPY